MGITSFVLIFSLILNGVTSVMSRRASYLYVGTYNEGVTTPSDGIYIYRITTDDVPQFQLVQTVQARNPTFFAVHPSGQWFYVIHEVNNWESQAGKGGVSAYSRNVSTGELSFLNSQSSHGNGPAHIVIDSTSSFALVSNYGDGTAAVYPILEDGKLGNATDVIHKEAELLSLGIPANLTPHAHQIAFDPLVSQAYLVDLGLDRVFLYRLDEITGRLTSENLENKIVSVGEKSGPRHIAISPDRHHAYLINENANTIIAYNRDASTGELQLIESISTLPENYSNTSYGAEIVIDSLGRFVYASNRGHDSIAVFSRDLVTGRLTLLQHYPTGGKWPRSFTLSNSGGNNRWLIVANQHTNNVSALLVDWETGTIRREIETFQVPNPTCVVTV